MSLSRTIVERAVWNWLTQAAPGHWHRANQSGDAPPRPFGTYLVGGALPLGHGEARTEDPGELGGATQITEVLRSVYELDVSLNFYGDRGSTQSIPANPVRAFDQLAAVIAWAQRPSSFITDPEGLVCLGWMNAGEIRDLALVVSADWEGRAQVDVRLSARFDSSLAVDWIESVEISGAERTITVEVTP